MVIVKGTINTTYLYTGEDVPKCSFPHWTFQKIRFDPAISSTLVNSVPGLTISNAPALTLAEASGEHRGTAKLADVHDLIQSWPQQTAKSFSESSLPAPPPGSRSHFPVQSAHPSQTILASASPAPCDKCLA